jgi:hypothetical protein
MSAICNRCRRGVAEFKGRVFDQGGKIHHRFQCTECGKLHDEHIPPNQIDLDDPRCQHTTFLTPEWARRVELAHIFD